VAPETTAAPPAAAIVDIISEAVSAIPETTAKPPQPTSSSTDTKSLPAGFITESANTANPPIVVQKEVCYI